MQIIPPLPNVLTRIGDYATRNIAAASFIPAFVLTVTTVGYADASDNGGGKYVRAGAAPAHQGYFRSLDGAYWVYVSDGNRTNVKAFGVVGDGVANDVANTQNAYNFAKSSKGGAVLFFPRGDYRVNLEMDTRDVAIEGEERDTTTIRAFDPAKPAILGKWDAPNWRRVFFRNFKLRGPVNGQNTGVGFQAGSKPYNPGAEFNTCFEFVNVHFADCDYCVYRVAGNIGSWFTSCQFSSANYHVRTETQSGVVMHGGCTYFTNCHIGSSYKASHYIDSPVIGTGQVTYRDCVIEGNLGFVMFVKNFTGSELVPGIKFADTWNESNSDKYYYTGQPLTTINIDGADYKNGFGYFRNVSPGVVYDNTPAGSMTLINTGVTTINSDVGEIMYCDKDDASTLVHEKPRQFTGTMLGRTLSVSRMGAGEGFIAPWVALAPGIVRNNRMTVPAYVNSCDVAFNFTGSNQRPLVVFPNVGVLPDVKDALDLTINPGETLLPPYFSIQASPYMIALYIAACVNGNGVNVAINGAQGVGANLKVTDPFPQMYAMIAKGLTVNRDSNMSFFHTPINGASTIRLFGMAVVTCASYQAAVDFLNSGVFPLAEYYPPAPAPTPPVT